MLLKNDSKFIGLILLSRVLRWGIVKAKMMRVGLVFLVLGETMRHRLILNHLSVVYAVVVTVQRVFLSVFPALLFCNRTI